MPNYDPNRRPFVRLSVRVLPPLGPLTTLEDFEQLLTDLEAANKQAERVLGRRLTSREGPPDGTGAS